MAKYTGAGALVEVDVDGTPTWTTVGCTFTITPPPQVKNDVEMTCQQDTEADAVPGIEQLSQFSFDQPYDEAASKTTVDDFYASGAVKDWRITFTDGTNSMQIAFSGYVSGLTPAAAGGNDPVQRTVTVTRKGSITYTHTP